MSVRKLIETSKIQILTKNKIVAKKNNHILLRLTLTKNLTNIQKSVFEIFDFFKKSSIHAKHQKISKRIIQEGKKGKNRWSMRE